MSGSVRRRSTSRSFWAPELVDRDDLLVQVVERRAGRRQPVLEDRDVAGALVVAVEVAHGADRELGVFPVLLGCQRARAGELRVVRRAVDVVPPGDDDLVVAREEADGLALEVVLGERFGVRPRGAASPHPDAGEGGDVLAPGRGREVCRAPGSGLGRGLPAVGQVPVVVAEDLEEVGDEAELGRRCRRGRRRARRARRPNGRRRARGGRSRGSSRACGPSRRRSGGRGRRGRSAAGGGPAAPRAWPPAPGRVHTFVPVIGFTCLMVPSGRRVRGSITSPA